MEAPELERRLAAIVAADVEGYSRLMHNDEEATMATLSARRGLIDDLIAAHRGRIANTAGDSVLAEFASVLDAVTCSVEIQQLMDEANKTEPPMRFRIGINVGDVMVKDGDIFGDGVNVAARLESLAEPGTICVSRGVRDHLRHRTNLAFDDLGEQRVKNIVHPIRAFRVRVGPESEISADPSPEALGELSAPPEVALELALWESVKDGGPAELASYLEKYPDGTFAPLAKTRQATFDGPPVSSDELDLAFWDAIKDSQRPEELAAYLESHPDGHFAALARARLANPDGDGDADAVEPANDPVELAFWQSIGESGDPRLFEAYLDKYPEGEFAPIARVRLESLRDAETTPASEREEAPVNRETLPLPRGHARNGETRKAVSSP